MQDVSIRSEIVTCKDGGLETYVSVISTYAGRDYEFCMGGLNEKQAQLVQDVATGILKDLIDRGMIAKPLEWKPPGGK